MSGSGSRCHLRCTSGRSPREPGELYQASGETRDIANETPGVSGSFAIQAGREIRIIVNPEKVSDDKMVLLAREIAKKIENELDYPGQIKVNMVRETRAIDYAK